MKRVDIESHEIGDAAEGEAGFGDGSVMVGLEFIAPCFELRSRRLLPFRFENFGLLRP